MERVIGQWKKNDPRIIYRGESPTRLDNLTDAVFGIAITLLIFNITNPNSFDTLLNFTKTFPAFLISIIILMLFWNEHASFSRMYGLNEFAFKVINVAFISLIIFYVYPLRFLSLVLSEFYFRLDLDAQLDPMRMPDLMIYYGFVAAALYLTIFFFYEMAVRRKDLLELSEYELFLTRYQRTRMILMLAVPCISILLAFSLKFASITWASILSGMAYGLYVPTIMIWSKKFKLRKEELLQNDLKNDD